MPNICVKVRCLGFEFLTSERKQKFSFSSSLSCQHLLSALRQVGEASRSTAAGPTYWQ
jgi:hypothetical protein